jgi:hypothetical protein
MSLVVEVPKGDVSTYQIVEVIPVTGKGTFASVPIPQLACSNLYSSQVKFALFLFQDFSDSQPEYCVRLRSRDLRDGSTSDGEVVCVPAKDPEISDDSLIGTCKSPPSEGLKWLWCEYHLGSSLCANTGLDAGDGASIADSGTIPVIDASEPPQPSHEAQGAIQVAKGNGRNSDGTGCQLASAFSDQGSAGGSIIPLILAIGGSLRRRKRTAGLLA